MIGPNVLALLTTTFHEPKARTRALSWVAGMASAGFAIGLVLGGLLTEWFGWRSVMFINVPLGIVALAAAGRYLPEPQRHPAGLDIPGAVTATGAIASLVYGFTNAAAHGWGNDTTLGWLIASVGLLAAFLVIESRTATPLLPLRLFADRTRAIAYAGMMLGPMSGMSMFFFMTQYLQDVRGMSSLVTGFAFLPMAVTVFGMSRLVPGLLTRFGAKPLALTGAAMMVSGLALLTQLTPGSGFFPLVCVGFVLFGIGLGLGFSPLNVIIMGNVAPADAGAAGGALQTVQQAGASLGIAILVTVFGTTVRHAHGTAHHVMVDGITTAFCVSAAIASCAFLLYLTLPRRAASPGR
jgi:MFS family permease